jgi:calcineurin-like phosphoesterase family protein
VRRSQSIYLRMRIKEHDCVVLTNHLPEEGLEADDVGTVVHIHKKGAAYEVEFVTLTGRTVAVATVEASDLRPVGERDISHVRQLQAA